MNRTELMEKVNKLKQKGFSLPREITTKKTIVKEGIYAFVFRHEDMGELGRITVTPHGKGQSQYNCEVMGDEDDPETKKRKEIFEPIAKKIVNEIASVVGEGEGRAIKPRYKREKVKVPSMVFPCKTCGEVTAMFFIDPEATKRDELEDLARISYGKAKEMNVPAWVLGAEKEIEIKGEKMGESLTMKLWPKRGEVIVTTSKTLNKELDRLMGSHC